LEISLSTGTCKIHINESVKNLENDLREGKNVILTDKTVRHIYGDLFSDYDVIEIGLGEKIKNLKTVGKICQRYLELEVDRFSSVLGIGGGVVCNITGFAASTYMRGLRFGFVPSTLVAQVDARINVINVKGYKNIVGVFRQPRFVLVDFRFLRTLPKRELRCGISEIIKHALINSCTLLYYLEKEWQSLLSLKNDAMQRVIDESIAIKSEVVQADEKEAGKRRMLDFGHMCIAFKNRDARPKDYLSIQNIPRPGHADLVAFHKYGGFNDPRGGGQFSGRLTAGLVSVGVIAKEQSTINFHTGDPVKICVEGRHDVLYCVENACDYRGRSSSRAC
jgi:3-dehydroquinate synthetase